MSTLFNVGNGVLQGGVLYLIVFTVYIDNVIQILKQRNVGCEICNNYFRVFGYTDDLIFLCPSLFDQLEMLNSQNIIFNTPKSQSSAFWEQNYINWNDPLSMCNGSRTEHVQQCIHLVIYAQEYILICH